MQAVARLVEKIESNTKRYLALFADAADDLLSALKATEAAEPDVADVLASHVSSGSGAGVWGGEGGGGQLLRAAAGGVKVEAAVDWGGRKAGVLCLHQMRLPN